MIVLTDDLTSEVTVNRGSTVLIIEDVSYSSMSSTSWSSVGLPAMRSALYRGVSFRGVVRTVKYSHRRRLRLCPHCSSQSGLTHTGSEFSHSVSVPAYRSH